MTAPQLIERSLTFNFAPSVSAGGVPSVLDIAVLPLGSGSSAPAGATFAGGVQEAQIALSAPVNSVTFDLIPSFSPGLTAPINYRVMWRSGVLGQTFTYDFTMPDADLTWDQLSSSVSNIIGGFSYIQQTDLGVANGVARLDGAGNVLNAQGLICATESDISAVENDITTETVSRESAVSALNSTLQAQISTQFSSALSTSETYTDNQITTVTTDIISERGSRVDSDADLQSQITNNTTGLQEQINSLAVTTGGHTDLLATKADLVDGYLSLAELPPQAITGAVQAPDLNTLYGLSPAVAYPGVLGVTPTGIYLLNGTNPAVTTNWVPLTLISSVNGFTGVVDLGPSNLNPPAIPVGGLIAENQVIGLADNLSAKANVSDLVALSTQVNSFETNPNLVLLDSAGVISPSLMDPSVVLINDSGQLVEKDGTIIPVGAGAAPVFSVNGQLGAVELTATDVDAIPAGGAITQGQITGLAATLEVKADLVGGTVPLTELPSIPQAQVSGLVATLGVKADLDANKLVPVAEIPELPQAQVTGLALTVSGNQLTTTSNAVNRIAALESAVGSGGSSSGGPSDYDVFYTSGTVGTPVVALAADVNMHSPFGIDSDGTVTGTKGTKYYLSTGVRPADVAWPAISPNGHLSLSQWNESGPPDPVYALASTVAAVSAVANAAAPQSALNTLSSTVSGLASQASLTALTNTVNTKANAADLANTNAAVAQKASQSEVNTINATLATLASQSSLNATNATVATLATSASLATTNANVAANTTALTKKANLDGNGLLLASELPSIPAANVVVNTGTTTSPVNTALPTVLAGFATLSGANSTIPVAQLPTNIPQSSITGLSTQLGNMPQLVGGVIPLSYLPTQALPSITTVANQSAMLELSAAQVQYGTMVLVASGDANQGTYVYTGGADPDTPPTESSIAGVDAKVNPSVLANWTELSTPVAPVTSVNGSTGAVVLTAASVGALAANASIPTSQVSGLTTQLGTFATTTAMNSAIAPLASMNWVQTTLTNSSAVKRADYVATSPLSSLAGSGVSVDSVVVPVGAVVLATSQSSSVQNGLWVVESGAWSRPSDYATGSYIATDTVVVVSNQTTAAPGVASNQTLWQMNGSEIASGFVDSTKTAWDQLGWIDQPFVPVAGSGIAVSGSTFSLNATAGGGLLATSSGATVDPNVVARKFVGTAPMTGTGTQAMSIAGSTIVVTHNLGNPTPTVSVWATGSDTLVLAGVTSTGPNSLVVSFASAPANGEYGVCVIG